MLFYLIDFKAHACGFLCCHFLHLAACAYAHAYVHPGAIEKGSLAACMLTGSLTSAPMSCAHELANLFALITLASL